MIGETSRGGLAHMVIKIVGNFLEKRIAMSLPFTDLTGRRFGKLIVLHRVGNYCGNALWLCQCDCGNTVERHAKGLLRGYRLACDYESPKRARIFQYPRALYEIRDAYMERASYKKLEWSLSVTEFYEMSQQNCHYCRREPFNVWYANDANKRFVYNGIDRIDSSKGYISGNVVSCCKYCNSAKNDMTYEEFKNFIKRLYENFCK